ncbi:hypothetical protein L9F63_000902, partial [Diploptera punctata]
TNSLWYLFSQLSIHDVQRIEYDTVWSCYQTCHLISPNSATRRYPRSYKHNVYIFVLFVVSRS